MDIMCNCLINIFRKMSGVQRKTLVKCMEKFIASVLINNFSFHTAQLNVLAADLYAGSRIRFYYLDEYMLYAAVGFLLYRNQKFGVFERLYS